MAQTSILYSPTLLCVLLILVSCFLVGCESGSGRRLLPRSSSKNSKDTAKEHEEGDGGRTFPFLAGFNIPVPSIPQVVMMPMSMSAAHLREPTAGTPTTVLTTPFAQGMAAMGSVLTRVFGRLNPTTAGTNMASFGALLGNTLTQMFDPQGVSFPRAFLKTTPRQGKASRRSKT